MPSQASVIVVELRRSVNVLTAEYVPAHGGGGGGGSPSGGDASSVLGRSCLPWPSESICAIGARSASCCAFPPIARRRPTRSLAAASSGVSGVPTERLSTGWKRVEPPCGSAGGSASRCSGFGGSAFSTSCFAAALVVLGAFCGVIPGGSAGIERMAAADLAS